jgi:hypothetical protein
MAWEIAVIVDPAYNHLALGSLDSDMVLWIVDTPSNRTFADKMRKAAGEIWLPNPICTTFQVKDPSDCEHNCLGILDTIEQHHPRMAKLHFVGIHDSEVLRPRLREFDFIQLESHRGKVVFVRSIASMKNVPHLQLDATNWNHADDVYESLFSVLGAPPWHGKNFDALHESIVTGGINRVEVPYILKIQGISSAKPEARLFIKDLVDLISKFEEQGCPIAIQIED